MDWYFFVGKSASLHAGFTDKITFASILKLTKFEVGSDHFFGWLCQPWGLSIRTLLFGLM
jgi:hypothetical protein